MAKILKDTPYANTFKELAKNIETIRLASLIDSIQDIKKSSQEIIIKEIKDIYKEIKESTQEVKEVISKLVNVIARYKDNLEKYRVIDQLAIKNGLMTV